MSDTSRTDLAIPRRADEKFCWDCGATISARAAICPNCGVPQNSNVVAGSYSAPTVNATKSKLVAGLLAIFLGGLGIHKFYLGRPWAGILYLVFCWTFIPAMIGFIEGIVYLAISAKNFDRKYNRS